MNPVLVIAGSDPVGGAGLEADLQVLARLGCSGAAVATAWTDQDSAGVHGILPIAAAEIERRLSRLAADLEFAAIKIGMLGTAAVVDVVERFLTGLHPAPPIVLDPVFRSSSGLPLLDDAGQARLATGILPRVRLATPNLSEARALTGCAASSSFEEVADHLGRMTSTACLVTGGDLDGERVRDCLVVGGGRHWFEAPRIPGRSPHGTGCALATATAAFLARGRSLEAAVAAAREFVRRGIAGARVVGRSAGARPRLIWDEDGR